jgi:membrane protein implicated in regulation of membrane protease activity
MFLYLLGGVFVFGVGFLLWQATSQRQLALVSFAVAALMLVLGLTALVRRRPPT